MKNSDFDLVSIFYIGCIISIIVSMVAFLLVGCYTHFSAKDIDFKTYPVTRKDSIHAVK